MENSKSKRVSGFSKTKVSPTGVKTKFSKKRSIEIINRPIGVQLVFKSKADKENTKGPSCSQVIFGGKLTTHLFISVESLVALKTSVDILLKEHYNYSGIQVESIDLRKRKSFNTEVGKEIVKDILDSQKKEDKGETRNS